MTIKPFQLIFISNSFDTFIQARQYKTVEIIKPIDADNDAYSPKSLSRGRPADLLACIIAIISASLSFLGATVFFLGFAANAGGFTELFSAFLLSFGLGVFAIIPSIIITALTYRAWRYKFNNKQAVWTIFLSSPWIILSILLLLNAPLPKYISFLAFILSTLLCLWGLISVFLSSKLSSLLKDDR